MSRQTPLDRELDEGVDALARYRRLIAEAGANGRGSAVEVLMRQHDREQAHIRRLRAALDGALAALADPAADPGIASSPPLPYLPGPTPCRDCLAVVRSNDPVAHRVQVPEDVPCRYRTPRVGAPYWIGVETNPSRILTWPYRSASSALA